MLEAAILLLYAAIALDQVPRAFTSLLSNRRPSSIIAFMVSSQAKEISHFSKYSSIFYPLYFIRANAVWTLALLNDSFEEYLSRRAFYILPADFRNLMTPASGTYPNPCSTTDRASISALPFMSWTFKCWWVDHVGFFSALCAPCSASIVSILTPQNKKLSGGIENSGSSLFLPCSCINTRRLIQREYRLTHNLLKKA